MATIKLAYDARNHIAKATVDYILSLGVFDVEKKLTPFEQSMEDIKCGRVTRIKDPANFTNDASNTNGVKSG
ncbi:hypothetical protein FACS1894195_2260 [Bacteroidia bacterium]|nr:hypothetical protein FACS1894195_2260 [Bacteroidia bacterium]